MERIALFCKSFFDIKNPPHLSMTKGQRLGGYTLNLLIGNYFGRYSAAILNVFLFCKFFEHRGNEVTPIAILGIGHAVNLGDKICGKADGNLRHAGSASGFAFLGHVRLRLGVKELK